MPTMARTILLALLILGVGLACLLCKIFEPTDKDIVAQVKEL
jgi:hypothetical protein